VSRSTLSANVSSKKNFYTCTENNYTGDPYIKLMVNSSSSVTYSWTGPQNFRANTKDISRMYYPGYYECTITNADGCTIKVGETICCCRSDVKTTNGAPAPNACWYKNEVPDIRLNIDDYQSPDTRTSKNGFIAVSYTGSTGGAAYNWTGPNGPISGGNYLSNLGPGRYCVTISDGCSEASICITLVACDESNLSINGTVGNTCNVKNSDYGTIVLNMTGGTSPYTYLWSTGSKSKDIGNLKAGQYCVTVRDKSGCYTNKCFNIGVQNETSFNTTKPCGTQYQCNNQPTRFVPYNGNLIPDRYGCNNLDFICPLTGGVTESTTLPYLGYELDISSCGIYGLCPNSFDSELVRSGFRFTHYDYLPICGNCTQCYAFEVCEIDNRSYLIDYYPVGDSNCRGSGLISTPVGDCELRVNEAIFLLKSKSDSLKNDIFILPIGVSDTLKRTEYKKIIDSLVYANKMVPFYEIPLEKELKEFILKENCHSSEIIKKKINSTENSLITISPNPFDNELKIKIQSAIVDEIRVHINNSLGKQVYSKLYTLNAEENVININTDNFSNGIYFITIYNNINELIYSTKIIKQ
jgi:Secretion system C-terminal sorting domain